MTSSLNAGKGRRMAKKAQIQEVRTFHSSNVGANEDTKTLWLFGAGASRHLGFPLSFDLFSKSVGICTAKLKMFLGPDDVGYHFFRDHFQGAGKPVPTHDQLVKFKDDPLLALDHVHVWEYLKPGSSDYVPIQDLFRLWVGVQEKLRGIGFNLTTQDLLKVYPEDLINRIRQVDPDDLVRDSLADDVAAARRKIVDAQEDVQHIYFFTLSRINDEAREATRQKPADALYTQLVRSFILEKNARIITFNYDTMLDEAIFTHFTRAWKYGGMTVAGINGYPVATGTPADLVLIKPHGSLNYLICGKCKRAHVNWFWSYRHTGVNTPASGNRRCVFCKEPSAGRPELMGSLTVAPLYDKQIIKRSYKAIEEAFGWADHVVSVGYSFPAQDTYVYRLMGEATKSRTGAALTVSVVSHTHESAKEIAQRLRSGLKQQGVGADKVKVTALDLKGFEEVRTGTANVPVKR
jgi:hypothetical protein